MAHRVCGQVQVKVKAARGLPKGTGKYVCYLKLFEQEAITDIQEGESGEPTWDYTLNFRMYSGQADKLYVEVFNMGLKGSRKVGTFNHSGYSHGAVALDLSVLQHGVPRDLHVALGKGDDAVNVFLQLKYFSYIDPQNPDRRLDDYGFEIPEDKLRLWEAVREAETASEKQRTVQWVNFILKHPGWDRSHPSVKKLLRSGCPPSMRGQLWQMACSADEKRRSSPGYYQKLVAQYIDAETPSTQQIHKDLHRTFPNHHVYATEEGRAALKRVLVAYSFRNRTIGYCQSMNFLCAFMLLQMGEEETFWTMGTIIENYIPNYYTKDMFGTQVDGMVFDELIQEKLSDVHKKLQQNNIMAAQFNANWFLCLFINQLPSETTCRFLEPFLNEGIKVLFRFALALLKGRRTELCACQSFEPLFRLTQTLAPEAYNADDLSKLSFKKLGSFPKQLIAKLRINRNHSVQNMIDKRTTQRLLRQTKFSPEDLKAIENEFKTLDVTGAGVDFFTFCVLMKRVRKEDETMDEEVLKSMFKGFDENNDEVIDFKEFIFGLSIFTSGTPEEKVKLCFHAFDVDYNGFIDRHEFHRMMELQLRAYYEGDMDNMIEYFVRQVFDESDLNKDGKLSLEEFEQLTMQHPVVGALFQLETTSSNRGEDNGGDVSVGVLG